MEQSDILIYVVVSAALTIGIAYFLFRWIFEVKKQLWNQKQMVKLLCIIAKKLGEDPEVYIKQIEKTLDEDKSNL